MGDLNERQRWALKFCEKVLDTCHADEQVAVLATVIEMRISALGHAARGTKTANRGGE